MRYLTRMATGLAAAALAFTVLPGAAEAQGRGNAYGRCVEHHLANGRDDGYGHERWHRAVADEHGYVHFDLDEIHRRWHQENDRYVRDRRWEYEHGRLHEYLGYEHGTWHESVERDHDDERYRAAYGKRGRGKGNRGKWKSGKWKNKVRCAPPVRRGRVVHRRDGARVWIDVLGGISIEIPIRW